MMLLVQGHALFVRQAGGVLPCPQVDFTGGFNGFLAAAYDLGDRSVEEAFGTPFDPFMNDQNFVLSVLTLEEFGATGNKVSVPSCQFANDHPQAPTSWWLVLWPCCI